MPADHSGDEDERRSAKRSLGDYLIRFGLRLGGDPHLNRHGRAEEAGAAGAVDIVDQAEAFQTLRVSDVMTPRGCSSLKTSRMFTTPIGSSRVSR